MVTTLHVGIHYRDIVTEPITRKKLVIDGREWTNLSHILVGLPAYRVFIFQFIDIQQISCLYL